MVTDSSLSHSAAEALAELAQRLGADPAYMASVLDTFRAQERLDAAGLAAYLGVSHQGLTRVALCKRPSSDSSEFAAQVRHIAKYAGVEPATLAQLIRQVDALEATSSQPISATSEKDSLQPTRAQLGWLAAARDRTEADEDQQQADEEGPPDQESGE